MTAYRFSNPLGAKYKRRKQRFLKGFYSLEDKTSANRRLANRRDRRTAKRQTKEF